MTTEPFTTPSKSKSVCFAAAKSTPTIIEEEFGSESTIIIQDLELELKKYEDERKEKPNDHASLTIQIIRVLQELMEQHPPKSKKRECIRNKIRREQGKKRKTTEQSKKTYDRQLESGKKTTTIGTTGHYKQNRKRYLKEDLAPTRNYDISLSTHGGYVLARLDKIPTLEDAEQVDDYKQNCKIVEGGIVNFKQFHATKYKDSDKKKIIPGREKDRELTDSDKDKIISLVGRGFAGRGDDDDFSDVDARVTHKLLYDSKYNKDIGVVMIMYTYDDPTTGETMEALAGVMILSSSTRLMVHEKVGKTPQLKQTKTFSVYNLVQICISRNFRQRGLAYIGITALKEQMKYFKADFLWWFGTATDYYNKFGYNKNPKMINCPFNLTGHSEEQNRDMFYFVEVTNKFQDKWVKWYNEDPNNRYLSFKEPNDVLRTYHGCLMECKKPDFDNGNGNGKSTTTTSPSFSGKAITHTFKEKLDHEFDFVSYGDECSFEVKILKCKTAYKNFKFKIRLIDDSLVVHREREGTMGNTHKYDKTFPLKMFPFIPKEEMEDYELKLTSTHDGKNRDHKLKLTSSDGGKDFDFKLELKSMCEGENFVIAIDYIAIDYSTKTSKILPPVSFKSERIEI